MTTLANNQIAILYLICFNISEGGDEENGYFIKHQEIVDELLKENGHVTCDDYIPDEEGAPINDTREVYEEYNRAFFPDNGNGLPETEMQFMSDFLDEKEPIREKFLKGLEQLSLKNGI